MRAGSGTLVYTYNAARRLTGVTQGGSPAGAYAYDFAGQRVWREVYGGTATQTAYVFDQDGHLLAEHDATTGAVRREYIWIGDMPIALADLSGSTVRVDYIHTGQIDEPLEVTDASQAVIWNGYVDPFGNGSTFATPTLTPGIDMRLPGQSFQFEAGSLSQNGYREYDSSLGRYIEVDPLGVDAGANVYGYVDGDPVNKRDPAGLRRHLTYAEWWLIHYLFGNCFSPRELNKIDIDTLITNDISEAAFSAGNGYTSFPHFDFIDHNPDNSLNLLNPEIASVFAHEILHYWQGLQGINVFGQSFSLHIESLTNAGYNPYAYSELSDARAMLAEFLSGNVEQQGAMFQQYVFLLMKGQKSDPYDLIGQYIKNNCGCKK